METLKLNKNNWTGDETDLEVNREEMYIVFDDERFYVREVNTDQDLNFRDFHIVESLDADYPTARGYFYKGVYEFEAYGVSRSSKDWAVAAAQLLFNIL